MLVLILPEHCLHLRIPLNGQVTLAASLLQWDLPFPLILILVIVLPTHEFVQAPKHVLLPPV